MTSQTVTGGHMDEEDRGYVCTLDGASLEKAKRELNEDPRERLGAVKALRDWIKQQPHLHASTDTADLLAILRTRKYSQLESRKMIENMLNTIAAVPEWFHHIDPADPKILAALDAGVMIPLPGRDSEGRKIIISQRGTPNQDVIPADDVIRATGVVFMHVNMDEITQVNGFIHVNDFTHFSLKHQTGWRFEKLIKSTQGTFPGRHKGNHFYNAGRFVDFFVGLFKAFAPKKYADRIACHSSLESLWEVVPKHMLPIEYLPDDYEGPNAGTVKQLIEDIKKKVTEETFRKDIVDRTSGKYYIDKSKRPTQGIENSFRKLNVD